VEQTKKVNESVELFVLQEIEEGVDGTRERDADDKGKGDVGGVSHRQEQGPGVFSSSQCAREEGWTESQEDEERAEAETHGLVRVARTNNVRVVDIPVEWSETNAKSALFGLILA